ncbi:hypothetical protein KEM54_000586 [Ascosphaera aggregata]|nr:hypothetical protein KEM54_000586 [Ascosphaera aggregata]
MSLDLNATNCLIVPHSQMATEVQHAIEQGTAEAGKTHSLIQKGDQGHKTRKKKGRHV